MYKNYDSFLPTSGDRHLEVFPSLLSLELSHDKSNFTSHTDEKVQSSFLVPLSICTFSVKNKEYG